MSIPLVRALVAAALSIPLTPGSGVASDRTVCGQAGLAAEQRMQLPAGLLAAIGRVESGRRDPLSGLVAPWPWSINAAGQDMVFDDLPQALARTEALMGQGVGSIDIGCFQINLAAHPRAFASLAEAFDPQANALYAATFLVALRDRTGNWDAAIAAYHSSTPERGEPYRLRVMAAWNPSAGPGEAVLRDVVWRPAPADAVWRPASAGVPVWTPSAGTGANVISFGSRTMAISVQSPLPRGATLNIN